MGSHCCRHHPEARSTGIDWLRAFADLADAVSWSFWLILAPTVCYAAAAVVYGVQGSYPMSVVYAGYSFANIGLLWLDRIMAK
jgi:hypothetical protein